LSSQYLLYFGGRMVKSHISFFAIIICLLNTFSNAATFSSTAQTNLAQGDTIKGDYWVGSEKVDINGIVSGDLLTAGREIRVPGKIDQDIFAIGQSLEIDGIVYGDVNGLFSEINVHGQVDGGLRVGASVVFVDGHVKGDMFAIGNEVIIAETGIVEGTLHTAAKSLWINGVIKGLVVADVNSLTITGSLLDDAKITVGEKFDFAETAVIEGQLTYKAKTEDITNKENVHGGIVFEPIKPKVWFSSLRVIIMLWSCLAAFTVGMILIGLWRKGFEETAITILSDPLKSIVSGFIFVILVPLVAVGSMILLVTIPGALIILALYAIILYVSKIITGGFIGYMIFKSTGSIEASPLAKMSIGVLLVYILINLPYIGDLLALAAVVVGAGALLRVIVKALALRSGKNVAIHSAPH